MCPPCTLLAGKQNMPPCEGPGILGKGGRSWRRKHWPADCRWSVFGNFKAKLGPCSQVSPDAPRLSTAWGEHLPSPQTALQGEDRRSQKKHVQKGSQGDGQHFRRKNPLNGISQKTTRKPASKKPHVVPSGYTQTFLLFLLGNCFGY